MWTQFSRAIPVRDALVRGILPAETFMEGDLFMAAHVDTLERELKSLNKQGSYHGSLICTDQGLLIASDGNLGSDEALAGFTSLFDDIVIRARRDLGRDHIDEITLLDQKLGRLVIRPILSEGADRLMLVVAMPADASWRRNTTSLTKRLRQLLVSRLNQVAEEA